MTKRTEDIAKTLARHWARFRGTAQQWDIIFDSKQIPDIPEGCTVTIAITKNAAPPLSYSTSLDDLTSDRAADA